MTKRLYKTFVFALIGFVVFTLFMCSIFAFDNNNIAYAADKTVSITTSNYYINHESLDLTNFYRDSTVHNNQREYNLSGENFAFQSGASVLKNDLESLVFRLNLTNPEYEKDKALWYTQSFVIYECSNDGFSASPVMDIVISHVCNAGVQSEILLLKRYQYSDVKAGIASYLQGNVYDSAYILYAMFYLFDGYEPISSSGFSGNSLLINGGRSLDVVIKTSSPYTKYFLRSTSTLVMEGRNNVKSDILDSNIVSVYDVLKNKYDFESLDDLGDKKSEAEGILTNYAVKRVKISYLKRIGETPFATPVTAILDIPVIDNEIRVADVKAELGVDTLAVMQSACDSFKYDEDEEIYKAYYYKSVWLSAKTADGETQDVYLDCNLSFRDFYYPFVRDGIFPPGIDGYEYFFNRLKQKCPEVMDYRDYELYGYFGYVVMPKTYSFSQFLFEICDASQANYQGTVDSIRNTGTLSKDSYKKLLEDYHYGWLQTAWNSFVGAFDVYQAYHYSFYVDSGVLEAFIAHNGAKDMYDHASRTGVAVRNTTSAVSDFLSDLLKKLGDWFEKNTKTFAIIVAVLIFLMFLSMLLTFVAKVSNKHQRKNNSSNQQKKSYSKQKKKKVKHAKKKEIHKR